MLNLFALHFLFFKYFKTKFFHNMYFYNIFVHEFLEDSCVHVHVCVFIYEKIYNKGNGDLQAKLPNWRPRTANDHSHSEVNRLKTLIEKIVLFMFNNYQVKSINLLNSCDSQFPGHHLFGKIITRERHWLRTGNDLKWEQICFWIIGLSQDRQNDYELHWSPTQVRHLYFHRKF